MKILLLIERESADEEAAWVADAADEYTLDEWNGSLPDALQRVLDRNPGNVRQLWVEIPDDSFRKLWDAPTVSGTVVPS